MSTTDTMRIDIPRDLYKKLESKAKEKKFRSVAGYIIFVLNQSSLEVDSNASPFAKEDEEAIKKRLESLGYM